MFATSIADGCATGFVAKFICWFSVAAARSRTCCSFRSNRPRP